VSLCNLVHTSLKLQGLKLAHVIRVFWFPTIGLNQGSFGYKHKHTSSSMQLEHLNSTHTLPPCSWDLGAVNRRMGNLTLISIIVGIKFLILFG